MVTLEEELATLQAKYGRVVRWVHSYPSRLYCRECGAEGVRLEHYDGCSMPALEEQIETLNRQVVREREAQS